MNRTITIKGIGKLSLKPDLTVVSLTLKTVRAGYDKAITFEFSHFMSPQSAYLQAGHLFDRYKEYFNIR